MQAEKHGNNPQHEVARKLRCFGLSRRRGFESIVCANKLKGAGSGANRPAECAGGSFTIPLVAR
jgi:hypothetical protein